jgi:hypothetical protein
MSRAPEATPPKDYNACPEKCGRYKPIANFFCWACYVVKTGHNDEVDTTEPDWSPPPATTRPDPETAAALREAVAMAERRSEMVIDGRDRPAVTLAWLTNLVLRIASRLEAGERPLLYPESTPEKKET